MSGNDEVVKTVSQINFGDFIEVNWWDHSKREIRLKKKGKPRYVFFDVPVKSGGWFLGVGGEETQHIILGRDIFTWPSLGDFDVDAIAILIKVTKKVRVIKREQLDRKLASDLKVAWDRGQVRIVKHGKRMRLRVGKELTENEEYNS